MLFFLLKNTNIIHIHSPHALKLLMPIIPLLSKCKICYTRHGAAPLKANHWKLLHKKSRSYISACSFVSQVGLQQFMNEHHWHDIQMEVIENGVNLNGISIVKKRSDKIRIGSVGRMIPLKAQIDLLKAVKLLTYAEQSRITVEFLGGGDCYDELNRFCLEELSTVDVNFNGMVSDKNQIYNAIDILCVNSETEGLSLAILEVMAFEKPIIASDVGGNSRLVLNGVNGFLYECHDIESLVLLIRSFLDNQSNISTFGLASTKQIQRDFSLSAVKLKHDRPNTI
jgi:glycosyltransferase involved in cell wall biosynthesis